MSRRDGVYLADVQEDVEALRAVGILLESAKMVEDFLKGQIAKASRTDRPLAGVDRVRHRHQVILLPLLDAICNLRRPPSMWAPYFRGASKR